MLDSEAQRQKAQLGHSKGLQNRRLPSVFVSKVGDDYYDKRKSYNPIATVTTHNENLVKPRSKTFNDDNYDATSIVSLMTPEEREKKVFIFPPPPPPLSLPIFSFFSLSAYFFFLLSLCLFFLSSLSLSPLSSLIFNLFSLSFITDRHTHM